LRRVKENKMTILDQIIARKREEIAASKLLTSTAELEKQGYFARACHSLSMSLIAPASTGIIAEFKRKSPSKGIINDRMGVDDVTKGYVQAGAACLSVLTDTHFLALTVKWHRHYMLRIDLADDYLAVRAAKVCCVLERTDVKAGVTTKARIV